MDRLELERENSPESIQERRLELDSKRLEMDRSRFDLDNDEKKEGKEERKHNSLAFVAIEIKME